MFHVSAGGDELIPSSLHIFPFAVHLIILADLVLGFASGKWVRPRWWNSARVVLAAASISFVTSDAILVMATYTREAALFGTLLVASTIAVVWATSQTGRPTTRSGHGRNGASRRMSRDGAQRLGVAVASLLVMGWSTFRLNTVSLADNSFTEIAPGHLENWPHEVARTDAGTTIRLYEWRVDETEFRQFVSGASQVQTVYGAKTILRDRADPQTNCHGWVFLGGRCFLSGADVPRILADNNYWVVQTPAVGDVIIYRDVDGNVSHSGIVQSVLEDGSVLIESKWGVQGRFLHAPDVQPYGREYAYYRSSRQGHLLTLVPIESGAEVHVAEPQPYAEPVPTDDPSGGIPPSDTVPRQLRRGTIPVRQWGPGSRQDGPRRLAVRGRSGRRG